MDSLDKKVQENDPYYEDRKRISLEAHDTGCLIHSRATQKLYTPKEFLVSGEKVTYNVMVDKQYPSVTKFYPLYLLEVKTKALDKAKTELVKAETELQEVINKIIVTFDLK